VAEARPPRRNGPEERRGYGWHIAHQRIFLSVFLRSLIAPCRSAGRQLRGPEEARRGREMEVLFVIYEDSFEAEVSALIGRAMVVARYSRIDNVIGARMAEQEQETGYLTDRRNQMILVIAEPATIARLVEDLRAMRQRKGHGLRAFVMPAATVI